MLDGMVALASGKASPRGAILNELPDRAPPFFHLTRYFFAR